MFKLVAVLFLITNGQIATEPSSVMRNKNVFPTIEACMNHFDTLEGAAEKTALEELVKMQEQAFKVEFKCLPIQEKA